MGGARKLPLGYMNIPVTHVRGYVYTIFWDDNMLPVTGLVTPITVPKSALGYITALDKADLTHYPPSYTQVPWDDFGPNHG